MKFFFVIRAVTLLFTMHLSQNSGGRIVVKCSVKMGVYKRNNYFFLSQEECGALLKSKVKRGESGMRLGAEWGIVFKLHLEQRTETLILILKAPVACALAIMAKISTSTFSLSSRAFYTYITHIHTYTHIVTFEFHSTLEQ